MPICCSRERGLLPIFKSNRKRSKKLPNCELFTLHHVIESLIWVKALGLSGVREGAKAGSASPFSFGIAGRLIRRTWTKF